MSGAEVLRELAVEVRRSGLPDHYPITVSLLLEFLDDAAKSVSQSEWMDAMGDDL